MTTEIKICNMPLEIIPRFVVMRWYMNILTQKRLGSEVIKLFSCSTQLNMNFILLINVKMPTVVGVLTFISRVKDICNLWASNTGGIFTIYLIENRHFFRIPGPTKCPSLMVGGHIIAPLFHMYTCLRILVRNTVAIRLYRKDRHDFV